MTSTQVEYWRTQENKRHNLADEQEKQRHNLESERETREHNQRDEDIRTYEAVNKNLETSGKYGANYSMPYAYNHSLDSRVGRSYNLVASWDKLHEPFSNSQAWSVYKASSDLGKAFESVGRGLSSVVGLALH